MSTRSMGGAPSRAIRKSRQLCRQVHEELGLALGELRDAVLDGLSIFAVELEGGGTRLRVGLVVPDGVDPDRVRAALDAAKARLREGIAAAINRKRTPQLAFTLIPAHVVGPASLDDVP